MTLGFGGSDVNNIPFTVPSGAADPLENTASASCSPTGFPNVLPASDGASVNLFQPSLSLTKDGNDFAKTGDTVTYEITIDNTSSADTPTLELASFTDTLVAGATPPASCDSLDSGDSCSFSYDYTVAEGAPDSLENTATALYNPLGFPNEVDDDDSHTVTIVHPAYTLSKDCSEEPVPQENPAVFDVVLTNTGDIDLTVVADEELVCDGTTYAAREDISLADGATLECTHTIDGPFTGIETVDNTIQTTATLPAETELPNTIIKSDGDSCRVAGPFRRRTSATAASTSAPRRAIRFRPATRWSSRSTTSRRREATRGRRATGGETGVLVLDRRSLGGNNKKMANCANYNLASHLAAAKLNFAAGAATCSEATQAAIDADALLILIGHDGNGNPCTRPGDVYYQEALELAMTLDLCNNNELCQ